MARLKCWVKDYERGPTTFWKNRDMVVSVSDIPKTKQWFTFMDPGKRFKVRIETTNSKREAIKFANAFMRRHDRC